MTMEASNTRARGRMRWLVVDAKSGEIVRQTDWFNNIILNNGMDEVAARFWGDLMVYGSVGTGTTATKLDSGVITATQVGSTVSASAPIFVTGGAPSGDVGNMIKWDTGDERRITAFIDSQNVTVTPASPNANSGAAGEFTIFRTNQTGLFGEVKRTNNYFTGLPNTGASRSGNVVRFRRTFDHTAEVSNVQYTEGGVSWASSGANTHFARVVFPIPVTVLAGQLIRVVYELLLTLTPATPVALPSTVVGFVGGSGSESRQMVGLATITPTGTTANAGIDNSQCSVEPSVGSSNQSVAWLASSSAALSAFAATPTDRSGSAIFSGQLTLVGYTALSFFRDKTITIGTSQGNSTQIRSIGIGSTSNGQYAFPSYVLLLDSNQTKTSAQTLVLTFRFTWGRDLL